MTQTALHVDSILEYVDQPQLFVARDGFDTMYLCLAFDDERYTAIRISQKRLKALEQHEQDLRKLFAEPENRGEYYDVTTSHDGTLLAEPLHELTPDRLPADGYYLSMPARDKVTVAFPAHDRPFFTSVIRRFGWVAM